MPVTVQDQIRLWEMEKHRVKSEEGVAQSPPKVPLTHVPSGQAISTKTFLPLATTRLSLSTRKIWASYGGPMAPNGCSLRTALGGQRFGSLLRGESLLEHNCDGPWCHLTLSSYPIWKAETIPPRVPANSLDAVEIYLRFRSCEVCRYHQRTSSLIVLCTFII